MRNLLSSKFRTTIVAIFDLRKSVAHKHPSHRIQYIVCCGTSSNRLICIHERTVVESGSIVITLNNSSGEEIDEFHYFSNDKEHETGRNHRQRAEWRLISLRPQIIAKQKQNTREKWKTPWRCDTRHMYEKRTWFVIVLACALTRSLHNIRRW